MRFIILSLKRNVLPLIFVVIAILLVVFSSSNLVSAANGLTLWATCVVPSLFPFFVITNLLSRTKVVDFMGKLLDKFMRPLFNVPGIGGFAFVMGLISGYPVGAKIVSDFRENGYVTKDEGERMLAFTNNSGPLFIVSSVGISLFVDARTGFLLLSTHVLACITVGIILGKFSRKSDEDYRRRSILREELIIKNKNKTRNIEHTIKETNSVTFKDLGELLGNSINNSISTILMIGGFVVIFSVIISILEQTHALEFLSRFLNPILSLIGFNLNFTAPVLSGIIELTNGVKHVSEVIIPEISQNVVLCAFLLGFGGFSVLLQVFSIVAKTDLSIKKYFIGKFLQGTIAAIYTSLALKFMPFFNSNIVETFNMSANNISEILSTNNPIYSFFYDFGILIILALIVFVILNLFNQLYNRHKV